jgi:cardiolipin synthase A/B
LSTATNIDELGNMLAGSGQLGPLTVAGQELRLYEHSPPLIEAMLADIRAAKERVWMESYIFAEDDAGRAVAAALAERATAGVEVRLMYDALGSLSASRRLFEPILAAGGQVHEYHTLSYALKRFALFRVFNRRNHRKLLVVDERISYFGGMNIVDQSGVKTVEDARAKNLPKSGGWRDLHVRMVGAKTADVAAAMNRLWQKVHEDKRVPRGVWPLRSMLEAPEETITLFDPQPLSRKRRAATVFVPLLRAAKREIVVSMAYFIPVGGVLGQLLKARRRGVRVIVIVPAQSDVRSVRWASRHIYEKLLRRGIEIYERQDQMLHSKVLVVDGQWSVIGSCNLDPRSLRVNLEFLGVMHSTKFSEVVRDVCAFEMEHSQQITLDDCQKRPWWERWRDWFAWTMRRVL